MSTDTSESFIVKDGDTVIYDGNLRYLALRVYRTRQEVYRPEFAHLVTFWETRQIKDEELR